MHLPLYLTYISPAATCPSFAELIFLLSKIPAFPEAGVHLPFRPLLPKCAQPTAGMLQTKALPLILGFLSLFFGAVASACTYGPDQCLAGRYLVPQNPTHRLSPFHAPCLVTESLYPNNYEQLRLCLARRLRRRPCMRLARRPRRGSPRQQPGSLPTAARRRRLRA
jgi:hypothetical protein